MKQNRIVTFNFGFTGSAFIFWDGSALAQFGFKSQFIGVSNQNNSDQVHTNKEY